MNVVDLISSPPITRTWLCSILLVGGLLSLELVEELKLRFDPFQLRRKPWTLLTGFFNFGKLDMSLLLSIFMFAGACGGVERACQIELSHLPPAVVRRLSPAQKAKLERKFVDNKTIDFAYFIAQICVSILAVAALSCKITGKYNPNMTYLSIMLFDVLQYIHCRMYPDDQLVILIVTVSRRYFWWICMLQKLITRSDFFYASLLLQKTGVKAAFVRLFQNEWMLLLATRLLLGQFWWFVKFFLVGSLYNTQASEATLEWEVAYLKYSSPSIIKQTCMDFPRGTLLVLLLPPWYFPIVYDIMQEE